jgi:hypothetical protein
LVKKVAVRVRRERLNRSETSLNALKPLETTAQFAGLGVSGTAGGLHAGDIATRRQARAIPESSMRRGCGPANFIDHGVQGRQFSPAQLRSMADPCLWFRDS